MLKLISIITVAAIVITSCVRETTTEPLDDGVPPTAPTGLSVYYAADGEIGIEWTANNEAGIDGYNIYKSVNDTSGMDKIGFTANDYYTVSDLEYDSTYYFKITAVDIFNNKSEFSKTVFATPLNKYTPYSPNRLTIHAQNWYDTLSITLTWHPPVDNDIKGYKIYRSKSDEFDSDSSDALAFTTLNSFTDTTELELLSEYFYSITTIDKGELTSQFSSVVSDIILDRPKLLFPANESIINIPNQIQFQSVSQPATYKLVVQQNPLFNVVYEKTFSISEIKNNISISVDWYSYEYYKKYYWRVIAYSPDNSDPNSFSDLYSFTIEP